MATMARSSWAITWAVWRALMLRESVSRLFARRAAWVWVLFEPLVHMAFIIFVRVVIRDRHVAGIDIVIWLMAGLLSFFMFRRPLLQGMKAIGANQSLFAYRQVKPIDTVIARSVLEACFLLVTVVLAFSAIGFWGIQVWPDDPLLVLLAWLGLWLLGLGWGLVLSVLVELVPETSDFVGIVMMPLYLLSGTMIVHRRIPQPYHDWLLFNPILHGIEAARLGFSSFYHPIAGLDLPYLYYWALAVIFLGLLLQARFANRVIEQ